MQANSKVSHPRVPLPLGDSSLIMKEGSGQGRVGALRRDSSFGSAIGRKINQEQELQQCSLTAPAWPWHLPADLHSVCTPLPTTPEECLAREKRWFHNSGSSVWISYEQSSVSGCLWEFSGLLWCLDIYQTSPLSKELSPKPGQELLYHLAAHRADSAYSL